MHDRDVKKNAIEQLGELVAEREMDLHAVDRTAGSAARSGRTPPHDPEPERGGFASLDDFFDQVEREEPAGQLVAQGEGLSKMQISKKIDNQRILDTLLRNLVSKRPLSKGDIDTVFGITIRKVVETIQAQAITLYLVEPDNHIKFAYVYYARSLYRGDNEKKQQFEKKKEALQGVKLNRGQGIVGKVIETCKSYCSLDAQKDPSFYSGVDQDTGFLTHSMITVPLMDEEDCIGAIQVLNKQPSDTNPGYFNQDDLHLLEEVAEYSSKIIRQFRTPEIKISDQEIASYVARMTKHEHLVLDDNFQIDEKLFALIGEENIKKFTIIPLQKLGSDSLKVAMANPLDLTKKDNFFMATNLRIREIAVSSEQEIRNLINKVYKSKNLAADMEDVTAAVDEEFKLGGAEKLEVDASADEDSAPIVKLGNRIIEDAYSQGASDIHIEPFEDEVIVRYRIDGILHEKLKLPPMAIRPLVARLKIMSGLDIAEHRLPQDGRIVFKQYTRTGIDIDLRVATGPMNHGEKVVMRILDKQKSTLPLDALGFSEYNLKLYRSLIRSPYGMILHCGPTGSGKSMTLYSALGEVNHPGINIQTAEDPIEYTLKGINQMQMKRQIGLTFATALRCYLRQDPDIILVGEIRDTETADIAIEAALTGHLLFSTLHTNDAPSTVARFLDMGVEPFMVSSSLVCVCAQRLLRRLCKKCKEEYQPGEAELKLLDLIDAQDRPPIYRASKRGCEACGGSGYKGRVGTHELMAPNDELLELINKRAHTEQIREAAIKGGMITLHKDTMLKVREGITSIEEALARVSAD